MHASIRPVRAGAAALAAVILVGCAQPSGSPKPSTSPSAAATAVPTAPPVTGIALEPVASGLVDPIGITNAGDGSDRLFVNERGGRIRVVNPDGTLRSTDFDDLSDRVQAGGERGLLGLALHPGFAANGRLFVHYSREGDGATVISELAASADRSTADPTSERIILSVSQPFANHNGGQLA